MHGSFFSFLCVCQILLWSTEVCGKTRCSTMTDELLMDKESQTDEEAWITGKLDSAGVHISS